MREHVVIFVLELLKQLGHLRDALPLEYLEQIKHLVIYFQFKEFLSYFYIQIQSAYQTSLRLLAFKKDANSFIVERSPEVSELAGRVGGDVDEGGALAGGGGGDQPPVGEQRHQDHQRACDRHHGPQHRADSHDYRAHGGAGYLKNEDLY